MSLTETLERENEQKSTWSAGKLFRWFF